MDQSIMRRLLKVAVLSTALSITACATVPGPGVMGDKTFNFIVEFVRDANGKAVSVKVTPKTPQPGIYAGGDAVISVPRSGNYKIEWESADDFSMKFETIISDAAPASDKNKKIGDESKAWTPPKKKDHVTLKNGTGGGKEIVISKYSLKDARSGVEFDPVIIIDR